MIRLCTERSELEFLPADPFAARITALFETYGANYDFARFWVQIDDENIFRAAISRVDGCMTVCAHENADFSEIREFIDFCGFEELMCEAGVLEKLGFAADKESFIVHFRSDEDIVHDVQNSSPDMREVYNLLVRCGFELGTYGAFAADACARINKGTARVATVYDGTLCACAFSLFIGFKSVLLGAVGTSPEKRGRGYASTLVKSLAFSHKDKEVFLFCRNDGLADFYENMGFHRVGRWASHRKE